MNSEFSFHAWLSIASSSFYLIGSILFHPYFSKTPLLGNMSVLSYLMASLLFLLDSLKQLLHSFEDLTRRDLINNGTKSIQMDQAVIICVGTSSTISGILFSMASIAFYSAFGRSGQILGNWMFRTGATLVIINTTWLLIRLQITGETSFTMLKLVTLLPMLGAWGFFIGTALVLAGGNGVRYGSLSLMIGSTFFLASSVLLFRL